MSVRRYLLEFNRSDDKLSREISLPWISDEELLRIFGFSSDSGYSEMFEITAESGGLLGEYASIAMNFDDFIYYVGTFEDV